MIFLSDLRRAFRSLYTARVLLAIGLVAGVAGALVTSRLLQGLLFGVTPSAADVRQRSIPHCRRRRCGMLATGDARGEGGSGDCVTLGISRPVILSKAKDLLF